MQSEGLRANEKSSKIIDLLLAKHPNGVPRPSATKEKPKSKQSNIIKVESTELEPRTQSKRQRTDAGPESNRLSSSATPPRSTRVTADWVETVATARVESPSAHSDASRPRRPPHPPGYKDVRFVRREMVRHINSAVGIRADLDESEVLLKNAVLVYNDATVEYREMAVIRRELEHSLVARFKNERMIWDGTQNMANEEDRERWEAFVKGTEVSKVQRKEEAKRKKLEMWQAREEQSRQEQAARQETPAEVVQDMPEIPTGSKRRRSADAE
ncbi:hypothetical protein D9615_004694 [Tricholomella constricta]|uniref:Uncharacterized protein n=1 Tax=Tricholomella constricta TaxID=117010 RepID=A0A8H5HBP8_9AGAR|nr:hypothetical protein D9615_004694 [Tricholomella constricta]